MYLHLKISIRNTLASACPRTNEYIIAAGRLYTPISALFLFSPFYESALRVFGPANIPILHTTRGSMSSSQRNSTKAFTHKTDACYFFLLFIPSPSVYLIPSRGLKLQAHPTIWFLFIAISTASCTIIIRYIYIYIYIYDAFTECSSASPLEFQR